jgi:protease I
MILAGKKVVVFVTDDYKDLKAWYPILRMREAGAEVIVIGFDNVEGNSCLSKHGYVIDIDIKTVNADPEEYDAAIIPGGWAPDKLRSCLDTLGFIKKLSKEEKIIASICYGGWVLASADVVSGKKLTSTATFYQTRAEETELPFVRRAFESLAKEEKKHETIMNNLVKFVDRPNTWLDQRR